jgi:hypothetical protein
LFALEEQLAWIRKLHFPTEFAAPQSAVPLTDAQVVAAARVLCKQHSDGCGVDNHDAWTFYSDDFKRDAREVLIATHGITAQSAQIPADVARDAARYRWLRDESPSNWTMDVGDLPLFKGDFDAAIDRAMAAQGGE